MTHSIVVGYDGSACACAALDQAVELAAGRRDGRLILVYCHEIPAGLGGVSDRSCPAARELREYERGVEQEIGPMLTAAVARTREAGVQAEVLVAWDDPAHALDRIARQHGSQVIVVGSHGEGPIAGALSRHTPFELLHHSSVPILVVPYRD